MVLIWVSMIFMFWHVLWYVGSSFVWFFSFVNRFRFYLWSILIAPEDLSLDLWGFRWSVVWLFGGDLEPLCFCVPLGSA